MIHNFYSTPDIYIVHPEDDHRRRPKDVDIDNKGHIQLNV